MTRRTFGLSLFALLVTAAPAAAAPPVPDGAEFFERKVRPVLVGHCYSCHSAAAKKVRGGLLLDTRDGLLKGGDSGPVVVPGKPDESPLIHGVRHADGAAAMPPSGKLPAAVIADLEAWVKMGAPDPRTDAKAAGPLDVAAARKTWTYRPVRPPAVPEIRNSKSEIRNEIDRFVLAKLQERGLTLSPPADKRVLLRRATFDLTGLPPTPAEIDAFLADDTPGAFARVVDRLLASPAYGERWGRHWLDAVRYADTAGDNSDYPIPQMVRYRDWVIAAINRDLPYDEFVRQQLAGDLMPATDPADRHAKLIATGYLANSKRFGSYDDFGTELPYPWHLTIEDTIDNVGRVFLGLTVGCARCHDHKFDPVSQADYYALYGFFSSTRYPWPGIELDKVQRDFVPLAPPERVAAVAAERAAGLKERDAAVKTADARKKAAEKAVAEAQKAGRPVVALKWTRAVAARDAEAARKDKARFEKQPPPYDTAYAVADWASDTRRKPGNARVQMGGDPDHPGPEVPRRFLSVLGGQPLPPGTAGSGRLQLAGWLTDPKNPLFARVMVNRVWHHHFGRGLVRTPGNFGALGQPPTHPELLDYLSTRFVADGWSVKKLHRLLMLSQTYQQASADIPAAARVDPSNDLFWKFDRRRLDAESIRDSLLAVAGPIAPPPAGPHPFPPPTGWDFTQHNPFKAVYESDRRSVYLMTQRIQRHPFLALFDGADTNASTAARVVSTTPLQALYLMNNPLVHEQAKKLAGRLLAEADADPDRVGRAYLLLYGRPPTAAEVAAAVGYVEKVRARLPAGTPTGEQAAGAWESLARALFLSNEFVYVD